MHLNCPKPKSQHPKPYTPAYYLKHTDLRRTHILGFPGLHPKPSILIPQNPPVDSSFGDARDGLSVLSPLEPHGPYLGGFRDFGTGLTLLRVQVSPQEGPESLRRALGSLCTLRKSFGIAELGVLMVPKCRI